MVVTYQTGCRPQESLRVIGEYVDRDTARWIFPQMKSKGKKSPRIIYLNDEAMEISNRLLAISLAAEGAVDLVLFQVDRSATFSRAGTPSG